jgi:hypothetical protein
LPIDSGRGNRGLDFRGKNVTLATTIAGYEVMIDRTTYLLGWNSLSFIDEGAILVTNGDDDTFPMWYHQIVEGLRTDVTVVSLPLLTRRDYVKQLKDDGVAMTLGDADIDGLDPLAFGTREAGGRQATNVVDFLLFDIVHQAREKRPVYFAVSVEDFRGYYDNLSLEGIVFRLVPETGKHQIDREKLRDNLFENYRYDYIVEPEDDWRVVDEFPLPDRSAPLVGNYAAGFSRLGYAVMQDPRPDLEEAVDLYHLALRFAPTYRPALNGLIAILAARYLEPERALPYAEQLISAYPDDLKSQIRFAGVHLMIAEELEREGESQKARTHLETAMFSYEDALEHEPGNAEVVPVLVSIYEKLGLEEKARSLKESWTE